MEDYNIIQNQKQVLRARGDGTWFAGPAAVEEGGQLPRREEAPPSKGGAPPRQEGEGGAPRGGEEPRRPQAVSLLSPSPQTTQVPPAPRTPSLWAHEDGGSVALPGCPSEPHPLIPDPGEAPFFQNAVFSRPRAETKVKTNQMIVF